MNCDSSRIMPPGVSRKRKERESFNSLKPKNVEPASLTSNRLLAGYMAYEFLTNGTLLGQKFDPVQAESVQLGSGLVRGKILETEPRKEQNSYAEVASILKTEGEYIPGIINPTQLGKWIRM